MKPRDYLNKLDEVALNRVTPEEITTLPEDGVFVFGSKPDGNHAKGAARIAIEKFGATAGKGEGFSGQSYAIPVHRHRTEIMSDAIGRFISFARSNPGLKFLVLPVGCGNAQMNVNVVADMFKAAIEVDNIFLPSIFIKSLRKTYRINANDPLPIKYVEEDIHSAVLHGRAMGLMMEISRRTDDPITFEDRILKEDNLLLHAFLRIVKVTTPEEQRVLDALLEEAKKVSGEEKDRNSTLASFMFVKGWKFDAIAKFEEGGSIYDLLEFSNKEYFAKIRMVEETPGYRGKLKDANLTIKTIDDKKCLCDRTGNIVNVPDYDDIVSSGWSGRGWKVKSGGKWGMLNERLEIMIPAEYEEIDVVYEGGFMIKKEGKWGYLPTDGPITPNCIYEEVNKYISSGWKGFRAKKDGKWGVVGFDGNVMVALDYDEVSLGANRMAKVKSDGLFGFVNVNNGNIIPTEYDYAQDFSSGNADMTVVGKNGLRGVIDINASVIIPLIYDSVYIDGNDRFRVKKDGHYGIVDQNLNTIFPFVYRDLGKFDKDGVTYAMNDQGKYGYVDENNTEIIGFQFANAKNFDSEGYAEVSKGYHQEGLIDKCGTTVIPMRYARIHKHWDGIVELVVEDERYRYFYGIHDLKTGGSIPCKYSRVEPLERNKDGIMEFHCWISRESEPIKRYARNANMCVEIQEGKLAVARNFAISLDNNGWEISLHGYNPHFRGLCRSMQYNFIKLAAGFDGYMALDDRGHIHPGPSAREFQTGEKLARLENVMDVVSCEGHTIALHTDGTVTCVDEPSSYEGPDRFADEVARWTDIKQLACGFDFVLGLKSDGTLVSAGTHYRTPDWVGVRQIDAFNSYYGNIYTMAILNDGTVVSDFCDDVANWIDVIKVTVGNRCAIGLKKDGTLYAIGDESFVRKVTSWSNVIDVECKFGNAIARLVDGNVVSTF